MPKPRRDWTFADDLSLLLMWALRIDPSQIAEQVMSTSRGVRRRADWLIDHREAHPLAETIALVLGNGIRRGTARVPGARRDPTDPKRMDELRVALQRLGIHVTFSTRDVARWTGWDRQTVTRTAARADITPVPGPRRSKRFTLHQVWALLGTKEAEESARRDGRDPSSPYYAWDICSGCNRYKPIERRGRCARCRKRAYRARVPTSATTRDAAMRG